MGQAEPLRNFGVFLDEVRLKQALTNATGIEYTGTLDAQQKMMAAYYAILEQTTIQQGDYVKYQDTLGNSLKTIQTDFANLTREIGSVLIPVITAAMPEIQRMATEIGEKLKTAVESIDWVTLITGLVGMVTFIIENIELIGNLAIALFGLNTIYKLVTITQGLFSAATAITTFVMGQLAAGVSLATIALGALRTAIITTGIGALVVGLGFLANWLLTSAETTNAAAGATENYGKTLAVSADQAERLALAAKKIPTIPTFTMPSFTGGGGTRANAAAQAAEAAQRAAEEDARRRAEEAERAAEEARRAEQERLDKRAAAFKSFADSVASTFGRIKDSILSSFNLPTLGNSVNSITRNIQKLLDKTKGFANSITQLSGLGLNSALLQQVIQAGPMAGSQLASAILGGGSAFIGQLNSAYGEFGNLASGIAGVGTQSAFANQEVVNNYYQIEVSGGVGSGPSIGKAIVDAIKSYERTSGAVWQGA
jgi:hypothetical protein